MARFRFRRRRGYRRFRRRFKRRARVINASSRSRVRLKVRNERFLQFQVTSGNFTGGVLTVHPYIEQNAESSVVGCIPCPIGTSLVGNYIYKKYKELYEEFKVDYMKVSIQGITPVGGGGAQQDSVTYHSAWDRRMVLSEFAAGKYPTDAHLIESPSSSTTTAINNSIVRFKRMIRPSDLLERIAWQQTDASNWSCPIYGTTITCTALDSWACEANANTAFAPCLMLNINIPNTPAAGTTYDYKFRITVTYYVTFRNPRFGQTWSSVTKETLAGASRSQEIDPHPDDDAPMAGLRRDVDLLTAQRAAGDDSDSDSDDDDHPPRAPADADAMDDIDPESARAPWVPGPGDAGYVRAEPTEVLHMNQTLEGLRARRRAPSDPEEREWNQLLKDLEDDEKDTEKVLEKWQRSEELREHVPGLQHTPKNARPDPEYEEAAADFFGKFTRKVDNNYGPQRMIVPERFQPLFRAARGILQRRNVLASAGVPEVEAMHQAYADMKSGSTAVLPWNLAFRIAHYFFDKAQLDRGAGSQATRYITPSGSYLSTLSDLSSLSHQYHDAVRGYQQAGYRMRHRK